MLASGRWKHEEPLELESESETDSEAEYSLFSSRPKPRRPKSDEEKRRIAERRVIREREQRERIQDESPSGEGTGIGLHDINTRAYENVKNIWTKRGIWNKRWGILPGMSWKHEEPFEDDTANAPAPQANLVENGSHETGEARAPSGGLFGVENGNHETGEARAPSRGLFGPPPGAPFEGLFGGHIDPAPQANPVENGNHGTGKARAPYKSLFRDSSGGLFGGHVDPASQVNPFENGSHETGEARAPSRDLFGGPPGGLFGGHVDPAPQVNPFENGSHETGEARAPSRDLFGGPPGGLFGGHVDPAPQVNPFENGSHETGEARASSRDLFGGPPGGLFGGHVDPAPLIDIFGEPHLDLSKRGIFPPVESNHRHVPGVMNTPQQGPSTDIDSTGYENGDAERSPSPRNSPRPQMGKRVLRSTTRKTSRPSHRELSHTAKQPQPDASTPLGPVHTSKVSKATGKKRPVPQRRPRTSKSVSSGALPLSPAVDTAKVPPSPAPVAPRRSPRLQRLQRLQADVPNNDTSETVSADALKSIARSKPRRNVARNMKSRDPTKPQGISKRQRPNTTRRKSRKNDR
ncbi:hypothetical protein PRK78_003197 [Emydomyces testavorans]|uniref:Uncharacterized protein n=1 Tax=Emydomyces testavorans TaxID=2070801 RepID=A0AAF0IH89_9EURO|nr:hypothetical protein PRK78_003197 [Emydomyces testavorans]